ncbi:hypothetical protein LSTR_LSTR009691 [Laodelphax striatellus]|uniref:Uncharacterized protein n=1 Tax=Laodelphax striatellus TaxID=195883 RepID=A0A482WNF5_LAOST|nr:hypothetical protein LSTR_LSTR009691 [Laodelphax striatellus]
MIIHEYVCLPPFPSSSPANITKRQAGCLIDAECEQNEWCANNRCELVCDSNMDCESWSRDGYCHAQSQTGVCRFHSALAFNPVTGESELRHGGKSKGTYCEKTHQCAPHLYCHTNNKCKDPCSYVKCTSSGLKGVVVSRKTQSVQASDKYRCTVKNYVLSCI